MGHTKRDQRRNGKRESSTPRTVQAITDDDRGTTVDVSSGNSVRRGVDGQRVFGKKTSVTVVSGFTGRIELVGRLCSRGCRRPGPVGLRGVKVLKTVPETTGSTVEHQSVSPDTSVDTGPCRKKGNVRTPPWRVGQVCSNLQCTVDHRRNSTPERADTGTRLVPRPTRQARAHKGRTRARGWSHVPRPRGKDLQTPVVCNPCPSQVPQGKQGPR